MQNNAQKNGTKDKMLISHGAHLWPLCCYDTYMMGKWHGKGAIKMFEYISNVRPGMPRG